MESYLRSTGIYQRSKPGKRQQGFSLIELVITVAVIAVMTTIAYPSYLEQIQKSRRADAQGALHAFAISMERYATEQVSPTFVGTTAANSGAGPGTPVSTVFYSESPVEGSAKFYDLTVQAATAATYELRATPKNSQTGDKCGAFTLLSTGVRGVSGASAGVGWQDCWK